MGWADIGSSAGSSPIEPEHPPVDMVNHPPHYTRGPVIYWGTIQMNIECIQVIRHIKDVRLATAVKYIWRVAFGGKENDRQDIEKAIFYLNDWLDNPIEGQK